MKKIIGIFIFMLLIGTTILPTISACTGFTASDGEKVLVGCNEDWYDPDFWIRFFPAENDRYGRFIIENRWPIDPDPDWYSPQTGMNDQGLFFDGFATDSLKPVNSIDKPYFFDRVGHYKYSIEGYCLATCATIEDVLEVYDKYNLETMEYYQAFFVDKNGDSVIIEGDDIIYKEGDFQVVTNFYQSHPEIGGYPCWRYDTAVSMLENMTSLSVNYFRDICNATHNVGYYPSVTSNIYDLNNGIVYLHHFYNYENVIEINLNEELEKGEQVIYLPSLFEPENNNAPIKPDKPIGPSSGKIGEEQTFKVKITTDPDGERTYYCFDWGDDSYSLWLSPRSNEIFVSVTKTWINQGDYEVRVKVKDIYGKESEWSDPLVVSMPKNKSFNDFNPWLMRLIQRFPILNLLI